MICSAYIFKGGSANDLSLQLYLPLKTTRDPRAVMRVTISQISQQSILSLRFGIQDCHEYHGDDANDK